MLQALLVDRFHLQYHLEIRPGPVYLLTRGKGELRLLETTDRSKYTWAGEPAAGAPVGGGLAGTNISMPQLAVRLSSWLNRPVIDQTGLKGFYDFKYEYSTDEADHDLATSIFVSIQAIGLRLKPGTGPIPTFVIDHIEKPSEN